MNSIKLSYGNDVNSTTISNTFIDRYMADANGTYVKVYLYLLRCLSDPSMEVSLQAIADKLDETEKDIRRALKYWEKENVLFLQTTRDNEICNITITNLDSPSVYSRQVQAPNISIHSTEPQPSGETEHYTPVAKTAGNFTKPSYSIKQMKQFREFDEFNQLIDYIEALLGRTLSHKDLQTPAFLYESLAFPVKLIKYLYKYCISRNKKSPAYIEKVAREWFEQGVNSVEKAEQLSFAYTKEYNTVKSAFGISRNLGEIELQYMNRWFNEFKFDELLVKEACNRTIMTIGKPDFNYADGILKKWRDNNVSSPEDVSRLDSLHTKRVASTSRPASNKFTQFPQRSYSDDEYSDIEKRLLKRN